MNVLDDIRAWLTSSSTGYAEIGPGSTSWPVYKNEKPTSTGNFSVIYQYGGMAPFALADGTIDWPRIQIITLTQATSDGGYSRALAIQNRLRYVANQWIPSTTGNYYIAIEPQQSPESIGKDAIGRTQWIQNFQIRVSYS